MKKAFLIAIIGLLAVIGGLFFFGQNSGQRMKIVKEGDRAPELSLASLEGKSVTLSAYRGKVVLVHFWATWCPPCVEEIPTLDRLYRMFAAKGLEVLAVSVDEGGGAAVGQFMRKNGLGLPVLLSPDRSAATLYGTLKFPETYIIDRDGIVRRKVIGAADWMQLDVQQFIQAMLEKK